MPKVNTNSSYAGQKTFRVLRGNSISTVMDEYKAVANFTVPLSGYVSGVFWIEVTTTDNTDFSADLVESKFAAVNKSGVITLVSTESVAAPASSGSFDVSTTVSFTATSGSVVVNILISTTGATNKGAIRVSCIEPSFSITLF